MSNTLRRVLVVAAGAVTTGMVTFAIVVPNEIQMPGTQPLEVTLDFQPAAGCFGCHADYDQAAEPGRNWEGSMMAHASRDPLFWGAMAVAEQDFDGSGDLCLRCHTPVGWTAGRSTPTDGSALDPVNDVDGVACDACHRMTNPDNSEHLGVQNAPFVANDGGSPAEGFYGSGMYSMWDSFEKLGPYDDAQPLGHGALQSEFHRNSDMCGTCHDVSNPLTGDLAHNNGSQQPLTPGSFSGVFGSPVAGKAAFNNPPHAYGVVERTYSEHKAGVLDTLPVAAYSALPTELQNGALKVAHDAAMASTAMGDYVDGTQRTFSCQTCHMPPVDGAGCAFVGPRDDMPLHDLTGANYWAPKAIQYLNAQNKLVLGNGLDATSIASMDRGIDRALAHLEEAAKLDVYGNTLRVVNLTGHKLISGYPEGRRMWLNVKWRDAGGSLVREDGAYGSFMADINGTPTAVESILDLHDPNLVEFSTHLALTQEWANQLLGLGISGSLPLSFDRLTGAVDKTLAQLAADAPGTTHESFHFVLNNTQVDDTRIPPYRMAYDEAQERNALPVPPTQFGNPGPGGVYNHWSDVVLNPPAGAVTADIDLLYQPTSWEYIQFLHEANTGAISHLATVGDDLLDAWLNTGLAAPHVMASTTWAAGGTETWTDLGAALTGVAGDPTLEGFGPLVGGESFSLSLSNAKPSQQTFLIIGTSQVNLPLKGGLLVPALDLVVDIFSTTTEGTLSIALPWLTGVPAGIDLYFQAWLPDAAGVKNFAASNGLRGTTR